VLVYHHEGQFLGKIKKKGGLFCPIGVTKPLRGTRLPYFIELEPEKLDKVELEGWDATKEEVIKIFAKPAKVVERKMWHKHGKQNGIQRFKCIKCHSVVGENAREGHVCK
jgi:hypothetical protein